MHERLQALSACHWIDGRLVVGAGERQPLTDPATEQVVGVAPDASVDQAAAACDAAKAACEKMKSKPGLEGAWVVRLP
mgnify:CR=1 FL=1